jgi:hypothetical protein
VHAYPQTMKAAVEARAGSGLKILAVTVLTSYDDGDLHAAGYRLGVSDLVEARAQQAQVLGVDGLVCSPEEAAPCARSSAPDEPGDAGHPARGRRAGDQKRIMTPARAIAAGADYLVVGRPMMEAADPRRRRTPFRPRSRRRWQKQEREEPKMAKGYWIARVDVHNMDGYKAYVAQNGAVFKKYGAKFLVRGGKFAAPRRGSLALAQRGARIQGL